MEALHVKYIDLVKIILIQPTKQNDDNSKRYMLLYFGICLIYVNINCSLDLYKLSMLSL